MTMDGFLDSHPLPANLKAVECQSVEIKFHFLHSLNPATVKSDASDSLACANSFWTLPDMRFQPTIFIDNWHITGNLILDILLALLM